MLHLSLLAPLSWRPSAQLSDLSTGSTILVALERSNYHIQFDGSVSGLLVGAGVLFNGIRVGEVTDLGLVADDPRRVDATISIASVTPVRSDTKVGLDFQGLTGVPVIALEGGTRKTSAEVQTLIAEAGAGQSMTQAARDALRRVDSGAGGKFRATEGYDRQLKDFFRRARPEHRQAR